MKFRKIFSIKIILLASALFILLVANANLRAEDMSLDVEGNVVFAPCAVMTHAGSTGDDPPAHEFDIMGRAVFATPCSTEMTKKMTTQESCIKTLDVMGEVIVPCDNR